MKLQIVMPLGTLRFPMRLAGLVLLLTGSFAFADAPRRPPALGGVQGRALRHFTPGTPNGSPSSTAMVGCEVTVTPARGRAITVKTDDKGEFRRTLLPGRYNVSFASCTRGCGRVYPAAESTITVERGQFSRLDLQCTVFGK